MLKDKIQEDLTNALRSKNSEKLDTLLFLMADAQNEEINLKRQMTDDEFVALIKKSVKKLRDAMTMFEKGGRTDLVQQNQKQIAMLSVYLPPQLSDEELRVAIDKLIAENKELYDKNPKMLIGIAMKTLSSQADPQRIMHAL